MKEVVGQFTRHIKIRPPFDKRDPSKKYGIHSMEIFFILHGPLGAIQLYGTTGTFLPHVARELHSTSSPVHSSFVPQGYDLGYHSPRPMYEGQTQQDCNLLESGKCYYDGTSLGAEEPWQKFIAKGEDFVWPFLEEEYRSRFGE